jgi:hypothetical protein
MSVSEAIENRQAPYPLPTSDDIARQRPGSSVIGFLWSSDQIVAGTLMACPGFNSKFNEKK